MKDDASRWPSYGALAAAYGTDAVEDAYEEARKRGARNPHGYAAALLKNNYGDHPSPPADIADDDSAGAAPGDGNDDHVCCLTMLVSGRMVAEIVCSLDNGVRVAHSSIQASPEEAAHVWERAEAHDLRPMEEATFQIVLVQDMNGAAPSVMPGPMESNASPLGGP